MLKFLRKKNIMKKIMWAIAILIIPAFVWWGAGSAAKEKRGPTYAGMVFGKKASFEEYYNSLSACRMQALMVYGENFHQLEKFLNLNQQAWDRIILLKEAARRHISVNDKEVINEVSRYPFFQIKGKFEQKTYELLLKNVFHLEPRTFEEDIRGTLTMAKLINTAVGALDISDDELKELYKDQNEKVKISYLIFEPKNFKEEVKLDDMELNDYYQAHKNEFKKDEQVKVSYIPILYLSMEPKVNISEEMIKEYYHEHIKDFALEPAKQSPPPKENEPQTQIHKPLEEVKEEIRKRIIASESINLARDLAKKVLNDLWDTPDLEKIAKNYSLTVAETGFFTKEEPVPDIGWSVKFSEEAFKLKAGEISDLITTSQGCYILQVKDSKKPYRQNFEEVKNKIAEILTKEKTTRLAKNKAEVELLTIKKMMQEPNAALEAVCQSLSLTLRQTQPFARREYVAEIGQSEDLAKTTFALKIGELTGVIETPAGYLIARLDEFIPIEEKKFAEEKSTFKVKALKEKEYAVYNDWFNRLKEKAKLKDNMAGLPTK